MNREEMLEKARKRTHEDAMKLFRIGNEDLTPVIKAARFGFNEGCYFKDAEIAAVLDAVDNLDIKNRLAGVAAQSAYECGWMDAVEAICERLAGDKETGDERRETGESE